jgi:hypothetical protein
VTAGSSRAAAITIWVPHQPMSSWTRAMARPDGFMAWRESRLISGVWNLARNFAIHGA